jgi:predicted AlkP superfamily phosphohydrolase/phosphomutase
MPDRTLIIGLDGADWRVLRPYMDAGLMPNLAELVDAGISGDLRSSVPTNSAVAWPTFLTGRNAGKHGVFDFTLRTPHDPHLLAAADSRSIRSETFIAALGRHGRKVGAINIPISYPPSRVNGFMLGGMFVEDGKPYTYPTGLSGELDEQVGGFLPNRIRWRYMLGRFDDLVDEATTVTRQRTRVLDYLMTRKDWDVMVQVFVSPDRLQHPLMHILDTEHPGHDRGLARRLAPKLRLYFSTVDDVLGRARQVLGADGNIIVISDHGTRSVRKAVYVRDMLARDGFARFTRSQSPMRTAKTLLRPLVPTAIRQPLGRRVVPQRAGGSAQGMADLAWSASRAYVTTGTSQGVYVNLAGREPRGTVPRGAAYERVVDELGDLLRSEKDPATNRPVISEVVRGRDLFHGPAADSAPDLLYEPAAGYAAAKGAKGHLQPYPWFMGDHDPDGVFVAAGKGFKRGERLEGASLIDVAPTVMYLAGAPIPDDMDGAVLDLFADGRLMARRPAYEHVTADVERARPVYTPEEQRKLEEQLHSLGYL